MIKIKENSNIQGNKVAKNLMQHLLEAGFTFRNGCHGDIGEIPHLPVFYFQVIDPSKTTGFFLKKYCVIAEAHYSEYFKKMSLKIYGREYVKKLSDIVERSSNETESDDIELILERETSLTWKPFMGNGVLY